jgi:hypothetical protein
MTPARGAIEAKGAGESIDKTAASDQVKRYATRYGQVLVTNLREFLVVTGTDGGKVVPGERFRLADDEQSFWQLADLPVAAPDTLGERFVQYLQRVLRQPAPLTDPADVAWFLASYAREAKARIEHKTLPGLVQIRKALEESLGLTFEGERGDHFFRSTLVRTLFYGIFSSWVLWCKQQPTGTNERFDWHDAQWSLHVPVINVLFEQVATRSRFESLGLVEVLDWAGDALNRVQRDSFFARFEEEHAVQYFYEPLKPLIPNSGNNSASGTPRPKSSSTW